MSRSWSYQTLSSAICWTSLLFLFVHSLEGPEDLCLLRPILELPETAHSISLLLVVGRVGLILVCCRFVDAQTALLLIMLKLGTNSTVSCANTLWNILSTISERIFPFGRSRFNCTDPSVCLVILRSNIVRFLIPSHRTIISILQSSTSYQSNELETHARLCTILLGVSWVLLDITIPSARTFHIIYSVCLSYTYYFMYLSYTYSVDVWFPTATIKWWNLHNKKLKYCSSAKFDEHIIKFRKGCLSSSEIMTGTNVSILLTLKMISQITPSSKVVYLKLT